MARRPAAPQPTATELGLMAGAPVPADRRVTLADWQEPPGNRWAFQHVRDLIPTARIARGDGPVMRLPAAHRAVEGIRFRHGRRSLTVGDMLDETWTDGWLVVHRGRVVAEVFRNGLTPTSTHLLMSVSKSLTATLAGALVGEGRLDIDAEVPAIVPELAGPFDGCSVRDLLDMRTGTRFSEDYDDLDADVRVYEQVWGWRPRTRDDLPEDGYAYMRSLSNARQHGGPFEYRSVLTDVLGWVLERAGGDRFADLFSRQVWAPMGAEHDAEITVDPHGCPMPDGGICATLRDVARIGLLHLRGGRAGRRQVIPRAWVRAIVDPDPGLRRAFETSPDAHEFAGFPDARYHLQWWVLDPVRRIYAAAGINGQQLLVHEPTATVVAKLSTWPVAWDADLADLQRAGALAVAAALADGRA